MQLKPFVCKFVKTDDTFSREPERVVLPVIIRLSSIVTSSFGRGAFINSVRTSGDVNSWVAWIASAPRTPVNTGWSRFALRFRALSTSVLVYVLLPFIVMDVPSEVSERLPADFKHLIVVPLKIGCDPVGAAAVNVSCLPEITGPLIVTLVESFASVIPVPALRALSDVPTNSCVELAGVCA